MTRLVLNRKLKCIIKDISDIAGFLWQRGWAEKNAGNISVDVSDAIGTVKKLSRFPRIKIKIPGQRLTGRCYLVTTAGSRMRELRQQPEKYLLLVHIAQNLDGYHIVWGGEGSKSQPTSEFISHLKIHAFLREKGSRQTAVIHAHPTHLVALTYIKKYNREKNLNRLLWSMHPEIRIFIPEGVGLSKYRCPGTVGLADSTVAALENHRLVIWEKHGCIAIGADVHEAFDLIDIAEKTAGIFLLCKNAGFKTRGLSARQLKELARRFRIAKD